MEKLIRHKIPELAQENGKPLSWRKVSSVQEHIFFLLEKVQEEIKEYNGAHGESILEEIADVLEVYDTLIFLYEGEMRMQEREKTIYEKEQFLANALPSINEELENKINATKKGKGEKRGRFYEGIIGIFPNS